MKKFGVGLILCSLALGIAAWGATLTSTIVNGTLGVNGLVSANSGEVVTGVCTASAFSGDGSALTGIKASTADYATLSGTSSTCAGAASLNVLKTGDTMTGTLTNTANVAISATGDAYLATGNSGKVGIGTIIPTARLFIKSNDSDDILRMTKSDGTTPLFYTDYHGQAYYEHGLQVNGHQGYNGNAILDVYASNSSHEVLSLTSHDDQTANYMSVSHKGLAHGGIFNVQANGNVGIGTISPDQILEVRRDGGPAAIQIRDSNDTSRDTQLIFNTLAGNWTIKTLSPNLVFNHGTPGDMFTLARTGRVGINTISPEQTLDVVKDGGAVIQIKDTNASSRDAELIFNTLAGNWKIKTVAPDLVFSHDVSDEVIRLERDTPAVNLGNGRLRVISGGNVGIATANPSRTLEVVGIVKATKFEGEVSGNSITSGTIGGNTEINTSGDITANNAIFNGNLWVKGAFTSVESTSTNFSIQQINHGPTTVALTIRPSVEVEGLSSIRVYRLHSDTNPTFEVSSSGAVTGKSFTGDGSGLSNVTASSCSGNSATASYATLTGTASTCSGASTLNVLKTGDTMTGTLTNTATTAINASGSAYFATSSGGVGIGTSDATATLEVRGLVKVLSGNNNVFISGGSLGGGGGYNVALGSGSLGNVAAGGRNTAIGDSALYNDVAGNYNTAVGFHALASNLYNESTAVGYYAGRNNSAGSNNVFLGYQAGNNNNGVGNVFIGHNADVAGSTDNKLCINTGAISSDPPLIYGDFVTKMVSIGTSEQTATLEVNGNIKAIGTQNNYFAGNVGIGSTNPTAKLAVNTGNISIEGTGYYYGDGSKLSGLLVGGINATQTAMLTAETTAGPLFVNSLMSPAVTLGATQKVMLLLHLEYNRSTATNTALTFCRATTSSTADASVWTNLANNYPVSTTGEVDICSSYAQFAKMDTTLFATQTTTAGDPMTGEIKFLDNPGAGTFYYCPRLILYSGTVRIRNAYWLIQIINY